MTAAAYYRSIYSASCLKFIPLVRVLLLLGVLIWFLVGLNAFFFFTEYFRNYGSILVVSIGGFQIPASYSFERLPWRTVEQAADLELDQEFGWASVGSLRHLP